MRAYSNDLRTRVFADSDAGSKTSVAARNYSVRPARVRRLKQRRRATGEVEPRKQRDKTAARLPFADTVREAVRQMPDATLDEYRTRFASPMSRGASARALAALGLTRKKSRSGRANGIAPTRKRSGGSGRPSNPRPNRGATFSPTTPGPAPAGSYSPP